MCEIFPEVTHCCGCATLRIGMLIISVLAVITGVITLSVIEKTAHTSYNNLKNITEIRDVENAYSSLGTLTQAGVTCVSVCFMVVGVILLLATLAGSQDMVQVFVWMTFVNVFAGFVTIAVIAADCLIKTHLCLVGGMDWISASALMVILIIYLLVWFYYIIVANNYVLNED